MTEQPLQQNDPNLIRVYDKYGRQLFVTKETWRTDVLPGTIQANWDNPDQLYNLIIAALNDGFRADILEAAKHLYDVDAERLRALVLAETLRGLKRVRPDIVTEFRENIKMLRAEHPLAGPAQQVIEQLFDSIFAASPA